MKTLKKTVFIIICLILFLFVIQIYGQWVEMKKHYIIFPGYITAEDSVVCYGADRLDALSNSRIRVLTEEEFKNE